MSVTIRQVRRSSGVRFKAILRDHSGRALRSKTFTKNSLAREWGKRILARHARHHLYRQARMEWGLMADSPLRAVPVLGITTGARRGTLESLRWTDIDFDAHGIAAEDEERRRDHPHPAPRRGRRAPSPSRAGGRARLRSRWQ